MKEYKSTIKSEKRLYKSVRKNFKRWKYCNAGVLFLILIMVGMQLWIFKNSEVAINAIIVGIGINFVPFLILCFLRATAVSGGRDILLNRKNNILTLNTTSLVISYTPSLVESTDFSYVEIEMRYSDINKIECHKELGYVELYGEYVIRRFKSIQGIKPVTEHLSSPPLKLYYSYNNMSEAIEYIGGYSGIHVM